MLVRRKIGLRDVLFAIRGSIVRVIAWRVIFLTALACGAVYWTHFHQDPLAQLGATPFTLVGISISVFMSFRNNACYDRWWEARRQWGALIVAARSLARETAALPSAHRTRILKGVCAYAHALGARLRGMDEAEACREWSGVGRAQSGISNLANHLLDQVGQECSALARDGQISEWLYTVLEARLVELSTVQAACERIKNTPLPFAYTLLIHRTTYLFCALLPLGLATHLGWTTPVIVAVVSYTFFGLDAIGDELEDPFGGDENDLPLDDFLGTIATEISQSLNSTVHRVGGEAEPAH